MTDFFRVPILTGRRIMLAFGVALAADAFQVLLGPLGWTFFDEIIDVMTMILTTVLIGFHPLLLPTFALELVPVVDMLPTWLGCVAIVVALRRKHQRFDSGPPPVPTQSDVIDV